MSADSTLYMLCMDLRWFSQDVEAHEEMVASMKKAVLEFIQNLKAFYRPLFLSLIVLESGEPSTLLQPTDLARLELTTLYSGITGTLKSSPVFLCDRESQDSGTCLLPSSQFQSCFLDSELLSIP